MCGEKNEGGIILVITSLFYFVMSFNATCQFTPKPQGIYISDVLFTRKYLVCIHFCISYHYNDAMN